jgi:hypothetical protein
VKEARQTVSKRSGKAPKAAAGKEGGPKKKSKKADKPKGKSE